MGKILLVLLLSGVPVFAQGGKSVPQKTKPVKQETFPTSTQALLDGVKSADSKSVIKSVLMILCRKVNGKGTGFTLSGGGVITTNSHVVGSCSAEELEGVSSVSNDAVRFSRMVRDPNRDLALLCTRVNQASPRLPDGRFLSFTIRSTRCILPAQQAVQIT